MRINFRLRHLTHGRINDPFSNPLALAVQDAGIRAAQIHGNGLVCWPGGACTLAPEVKEMHHRMILGDRYEALNAEVHDRIYKLTHIQKGKKVEVQDLHPEDVLFSFTVAHNA